MQGWDEPDLNTEHRRDTPWGSLMRGFRWRLLCPCFPECAALSDGNNKNTSQVLQVQVKNQVEEARYSKGTIATCAVGNRSTWCHVCFLPKKIKM